MRTRPAGSLAERVCAALAARATFALFAAIASPVPAFAEACPPAEIRIESRYRPPVGFELGPQPEFRARSAAGKDMLGAIESGLGWHVDVGIERRCRGGECRLCVNRIEGEAGFGPSRLWVTDKLRGDRCRTDAVLAHERKHARVFEESTTRGVSRISDTLERWARRQRALTVPSDAYESAAQARHREVRRMMEEGVAWIERRARARNERLDSPQAYEAERERMERMCGGR